MIYRLERTKSRKLNVVLNLSDFFKVLWQNYKSFLFHTKKLRIEYTLTLNFTSNLSFLK